MTGETGPVFVRRRNSGRGMDDKRFTIGRLQIRATDGLILTTLAFLSLLTFLSGRRVEHGLILVLKNIGVASAYILFIYFSERTNPKFWKFMIRMCAILFLYAYLNVAVDKLQLIIHGHWLDGQVIGLERSIFGVQPTLWLQRFVSKPVTEWMMFSYVIYLVIFPLLSGVIFFLRNGAAVEDYFFTLGISNVLCDLCFALFPVAGPIAHMGSLYGVKLDGYFWTRTGEWLRSMQFVGGTIPSPHCANTTVMWMMAYRYHRPSFWMISPVVLSLFMATIYCRYHYVTDSILGMAAGFFVFFTAPRLMDLWDGIVDLTKNWGSGFRDLS